MYVFLPVIEELNKRTPSTKLAPKMAEGLTELKVVILLEPCLNITS